MKASNPLDHSSRFSPNIVITDQQFRKDALELVAGAMGKTKLSKKEEKAAEVLIANLMATYRKDRDLFLAISRDNNTYKQSSMYNKTAVSTAMLRRVADSLADAHLAELEKGFMDRRYGRSRVARLKWTETLVEFFYEFESIPLRDLIEQLPCEIRLKDEDKNPLEFEPNAATEAMAQGVTRWNDFMANHYVDLAIPEEELEKYITPRNQLHRVFNNGNFEHGGRHYGHWIQEIPRGLRKEIVIDGKSTVEIDFSSLHPRLLYGMEGLKLDDNYDPYIAIEGLSRGQVKLVT